MKNIIVLIAFAFFTITAAFSQDKAYISLTKYFPGLQKGMIIFQENKQHSIAVFYHEQKKYIVSFDENSDIETVKQLFDPKQLSVNIVQDLNCFFKSYNILETSVTHFYHKDEMQENTDTTVVVGDYWTATALVYTNGERPEEPAEASKGEFEYEVFSVIRLGLRPCETQRWYGGSAQAFCDSLQKHLLFHNDSCIQRFEENRYVVYLTIGEFGEVQISYISGLTPYVFDEKLEAYCRSIRFPKQPEKESLYTCEWKYVVYITLSENGTVTASPTE